MKENKGITLIALLVTIIIMLILIGVSMKIVIDGNLFPSAQNAVDKTNNKVAQQQDIVNGLMDEWDDVVQSQCSHSWGEWTVTKEATDTESGTKERTCSLCGKTEIKTIVKIIVGSYIEGYDPSIAEDGSTISTSYLSTSSLNGYGDQTFTVSSIIKWRILGEENGQIIITPADPILNDAGSKFSLRGQAGDENFIEELNKISSIYGQGKYADTSKYSVNLGEETIVTGGRSIKLEDIGCTINETPSTRIYKKQQNTADEEDTTYYIYYGDSADNLTKSNSTSFIYWGDDSVENPGAEWKALGNDESVTIKSYGYTIGTRTTKQTEMIFKKSDGSSYANYYLASRGVAIGAGFLIHSARCVDYGGENNAINLYVSDSGDQGGVGAVRPTVYLSPDVELEYNSETGVYVIQ